MMYDQQIIKLVELHKENRALYWSNLWPQVKEVDDKIIWLRKYWHKRNEMINDFQKAFLFLNENVPEMDKTLYNRNPYKL